MELGLSQDDMLTYLNNVCCLFAYILQLNSPMNSVSSSEDIKPPLGINGVMKVPAQPSGTPLSLTKHICAICGDRSSGTKTHLYAKVYVQTDRLSPNAHSASVALQG